MVDLGLNLSGVVSALYLQPQPVLAQVVFGSNPAALLGIALAVGGAGLYFLRNFRPQSARDQDIALAAVLLLCGAILFFQGWRLDPILTFGFFLMAGAAAAFALETIRLRGATTEQAKRYTPLVDDERPVSRVYRAELDELSAVEDRSTTRRIRASRDYRSDDLDDYADEGRRRPSIRGGSDRPERPSPNSPSSRKRRPPASSSRPESRPPSRSVDRGAWDDEAPSRSERGVWDDDFQGTPSTRGGSNPARPSERGSASSSRPKRPRPTDDSVGTRRTSEQPAADYVDYQPIDYSDDEADNSSNFD
jgi:Ycf66 protein N-terminus